MSLKATVSKTISLIASLPLNFAQIFYGSGVLSFLTGITAIGDTASGDAVSADMYLDMDAIGGVAVGESATMDAYAVMEASGGKFGYVRQSVAYDSGGTEVAANIPVYEEV